MTQHYDVIIIGSRVAGSVLASKLGDANVSVLIIDKDSFPSKTPSTHYFRGISALRVFNEIGILNELLESGAPKLTHEVDFVGGTKNYLVREAYGVSDVGYNINIRRYVLDNILNKRVLSTPNVTFMDNTRMEDLDFELDKVIVKLSRYDEKLIFTSDLVVGADGKFSTVASIVKPENEHYEKSHRVIIYQYLKKAQTFDSSTPFAAEFSMFMDEVAYFFPIDSGSYLAAISLNTKYLDDIKQIMKFDHNLIYLNHPSIYERVKEGIPESKPIRVRIRENYMRKPVGHRWALIGDSGIHLDPWSGLGIDLASISAGYLAEELIKMKQEGYDLQTALRDFHIKRNEVAEKLYLNTVYNSRDLTELTNKNNERIMVSKSQ